MIPIDFEQANSNFSAPPDYAESQVCTIKAYSGKVLGGSVDGVPIVVVAWKPTDRELELINEGKPIFLSCIGGLPPHFLSMSFEEATRPL